jgi:tetratricopeptide (TPR) repeat protein
MTPVKARLLELIDGAHRQSLELLQPHRAEAPPEQGWDARDNLHHMASWKERWVRWLEAPASGRASLVVDDIDAFNDRLAQEGRAKSWEDVAGAAATVNGQLRGAIEGLSEEQLQEQVPALSSLEKRPLWRRLLLVGFTHPVDHLADFLWARGDMAEARRLRVAAVDQVKEAFGEGDAYAVLVYNLACFDALHGRRTEAVAEVREALRIDPGLSQWAAQDSELESLRGLPEYEELYT